MNVHKTDTYYSDQLELHVCGRRRFGVDVFDVFPWSKSEVINKGSADYFPAVERHRRSEVYGPMVNGDASPSFRLPVCIASALITDTERRRQRPTLVHGLKPITITRTQTHVKRFMFITCKVRVRTTHAWGSGWNVRNECVRGRRETTGHGPSGPRQ